MADLDPVLLAVSDLLVLDALTRAWSRTVKRSDRAVPAGQRHTEYQRRPVPVDRLDAVLHDAWVLCPMLAERHSLPVSIVPWQDALDSYTRALLMMSERHTPGRLLVVLQQVPQWVPDPDDG